MSDFHEAKPGSTESFGSAECVRRKFKMKFVFAGLMFLSVSLVSENIMADSAGSFETAFSFRIKVGDSASRNITPIGAERRIPLPGAFGTYHCFLTERHLSDDGKDYYQNIACADMSETTLNVVSKISIMCPIDHIGADYKDMEIAVFDTSTRKTIQVLFYGECSTRSI